MQAIAIKDYNGNISFLGLDKPALATSNTPRVDEEWEVEVVRDEGDHYVVRPLYKLEKKVHYRIRSFTVMGLSIKDTVEQTCRIGERELWKKHIGLFQDISDCKRRDLPLPLRKTLLKNRLLWEEKKKVLSCLITWPNRPGVFLYSKHGLSGTIHAKEAGRFVNQWFIGNGFIIQGPQYGYEREMREIGKRVLQGAGITFVIDTSKREGFLLELFKRARIKCEGITMPVPEGLQRKQDIIEYLKERAC